MAAGTANSADPDQTASQEQSDLGLHCMLEYLCPKICIKVGNISSKFKIVNMVNSPEKKLESLMVVT